MKNMKIICYIIFLCISLYNVNGLIYANQQENDNIFTQLSYNDHSGKAIFKINNNIEKLPASSLNFKFNEIKGKIKSYDVKIKNICEKNYTQNIFRTENIYNHKNNTYYDYKVLDYIIQYNESYICWQYFDYIPLGISHIKIDNVKFIYDNGAYEIDWIPILTTKEKIYKQKKWAWWNATFLNYKNIVIKEANSLLINFPVLIHLNDTSNIHNNGSDIRFIDLNGSALNYEIEKFEINDSDIWVNIPSINTTNKTIRMYYNNENVSDGQNINDVWNDNIMAVYHMSNLNDSKSNHDLNIIATPTITTNAKIGNAYDLDLCDVLYPMDHSDFSFTDANQDKEFTISLWINVDTMTSTGRLLNKATSAQLEYISQYTPSGIISFNMYHPNCEQYISRTSSTGEIITDSWLYITYSYNGNENPSGIDIYKNGIIIDTTDINSGSYAGMDDTASKPSIGASWNIFPSITEPIDAKIDEVRWENIERNQDWINYTYQNIQNQELFIKIGIVQNFTTINIPPIFNYSIPNFTQYINTSINYSNYYYDPDNDTVTINSSCNIINVSITDNYKFNIFYYANNINKSYCNLTICDYQNCTTSNNFYIEILSIPEIKYNYAFLDLRERNDIMILTLLFFIYVCFICFGIFTRNIIIKSFAVMLGITIGLILFQIHWFLFLLFTFKNILIWIYT